jgi:hypothetical protein
MILLRAVTARLLLVAARQLHLIAYAATDAARSMILSAEALRDKARLRR